MHENPALSRSRRLFDVLTRCAPSVQASARARQEPMMAETIAFVLRNLPVFLFVAALALAAAWRTGAPVADRLLAWILLLPIGVTGLWAAVFHLFFPQIAAADIGWEPSPFQFEVGVADLAIGATACVSFWRSLEFKAAAVMVNSIAPARRRDRSCETDDRRRQLRFRQRRRSLLQRHRLSRAGDHSPHHRATVSGGGADVLKFAQNTMTLRSAAPEREEARASLIDSSR